jgi:KDO2-lipid IV(A) lauroyltransferase
MTMLRGVTPYTLAAGFGTWLFFAAAGLLPLDAASAIGGFLARAIGPWLPITERARRQLRSAMPELSEAEIARIVRAMWDNLGRVAAEYPHLHEIRCYEGGRVEVVGAEHIDALREDGKGGIFFSGHLGNWEIASLAATQRGVPLTQVYRAPNNPIVDRLVFAIRERAITGRRFPKGAEGARRLVRHLAQGEHLAMLVDQKLNEGIPVPFFGREAMTVTALAAFALKYDVPVVPARVERLKGARFRITVFAPLALPQTGERDADIAETMRRVNALIESWVREKPEQWLWLHQRWPKEPRLKRAPR